MPHFKRPEPAPKPPIPRIYMRDHVTICPGDLIHLISQVQVSGRGRAAVVKFSLGGVEVTINLHSDPIMQEVDLIQRAIWVGTSSGEAGTPTGRENLRRVVYRLLQKVACRSRRVQFIRYYDATTDEVVRRELIVHHAPRAKGRIIPDELRAVPYRIPNFKKNDRALVGLPTVQSASFFAHAEPWPGGVLILGMASRATRGKCRFELEYPDGNREMLGVKFGVGSYKRDVTFKLLPPHTADITGDQSYIQDAPRYVPRPPAPGEDDPGWEG